MFSLCFFFFNFYTHASFFSDRIKKYQTSNSGYITTWQLTTPSKVSCLEPPNFQVQSAGGGPKKYSGPVDVIRSLYKEGGIRSIFKGSAATAARGRAGHTFNKQHDGELVFSIHSYVAIVFMWSARYKHLSLQMNSVQYSVVWWSI